MLVFYIHYRGVPAVPPGAPSAGRRLRGPLPAGGRQAGRDAHADAHEVHHTGARGSQRPGEGRDALPVHHAAAHGAHTPQDVHAVGESRVEWRGLEACCDPSFSWKSGFQSPVLPQNQSEMERKTGSKGSPRLDSTSRAYAHDVIRLSVRRVRVSGISSRRAKHGAYGCRSQGSGSGSVVSWWPVRWWTKRKLPEARDGPRTAVRHPFFEGECMRLPYILDPK